jgi:2'-5' RNA ligase
VSETLRAFVSVPVEEARVLERLAALKREIHDDVRWVPPHQLHFSLKFMAALDPALLAGAKAALGEAARAGEPFRLAHEGLGTFPPGRPARVLWVGCGDGRAALEALAASVDAAFHRAGVPREERPFTAHLTLGRARDERGSRAVAEEAKRRTSYDAGAVDVEELVLVRSVLGPHGPSHTPVARARIGSAALLS